MDEVEFKKYINMIMCMCLDFLMDGIDKDAFLSNLKLAMKQIDDDSSS
jgi:hypothetical protein